MKLFDQEITSYSFDGTEFYMAEQFPFEVNVFVNNMGVSWAILMMGNTKPIKSGRSDSIEQAIEQIEMICYDLVNQIDLHRIRYILKS